MAFVVYLVLFLAFIGHSSALYCICRDGVGDSSLQKSLDYACGAGADCTPILQNGACYNPNTVKDHCSYAVNSYFQKKGQSNGTCDFSGTASTSANPPSSKLTLSTLINVNKPTHQHICLLIICSSLLCYLQIFLPLAAFLQVPPAPQPHQPLPQPQAALLQPHRRRQQQEALHRRCLVDWAPPEVGQELMTVAVWVSSKQPTCFSLS
ncbi:hypothetical protein Dsin_009895 [Dipteronia sinensis]|uniref:X8 domain-containing protein n=1 Tax=Dipteronia sinensis TaxID=43782 RepID=A0AAE0ASD5_9ROSI|nr:hypothetical protein Dsin_009895 [Dipteronia sinensis]